MNRNYRRAAITTRQFILGATRGAALALVIAIWVGVRSTAAGEIQLCFSDLSVNARYSHYQTVSVAFTPESGFSLSGRIDIDPFFAFYGPLLVMHCQGRMIHSGLLQVVSAQQNLSGFSIAPEASPSADTRMTIRALERFHSSAPYAPPEEYFHLFSLQPDGSLHQVTYSPVCGRLEATPPALKQLFTALSTATAFLQQAPQQPMSLEQYSHQQLLEAANYQASFQTDQLTLYWPKLLEPQQDSGPLSLDIPATGHGSDSGQPYSLNLSEPDPEPSNPVDASFPAAVALPGVHPDNPEIAQLMRQVRAAGEHPELTPLTTVTTNTSWLPRLDYKSLPMEQGTATLITPLLAGSDAIVYRGLFFPHQNPSAVELVVIKQMLRNPTNIHQEYKRLNLEAFLEWCSQSGGHAHIIPVLDKLVTEQQFLMVEKAALPLSTDTPWQEEILKIYAVQILAAIAHLHTNHYAHLDIKPQNSLQLPDTGKPSFAITDFGELSQVGENSLQTPLRGTRDFLPASVLLHFQRQLESTGIISEREEITVNPYQLDLEALGLTLLTLFLGDTPYDLLSRCQYQRSPQEQLSKYVYLLSELERTAGTRRFPDQLHDFIKQCSGRPNLPTPPQWLAELLKNLFQSLDVHSQTASVIHSHLRRALEQGRNQPESAAPPPKSSPPQQGINDDNFLTQHRCNNCNMTFNLLSAGGFEQMTKHLLSCSKPPPQPAGQPVIVAPRQSTHHDRNPVVTGSIKSRIFTTLTSWKK